MMKFSLITKTTVDLYLLRRFAKLASSGNFSTEKQELEKRIQMHVNLECSARKYESAKASSFGKCVGPSSRFW